MRFFLIFIVVATGIALWRSMPQSQRAIYKTWLRRFTVPVVAGLAVAAMLVVLSLNTSLKVI